MTEAEIAWCAALFEGEGSISIRHVQPTPRVEVRLGMTDRDVVERFRERIGVGTIYSTRSPSLPDHCKTKYQWCVTKREEVIPVLELLLPWFGERRSARAQEAIEVLADLYRFCFCGREFMARRPEQTFCSRQCKNTWSKVKEVPS